MEKKMREKGIAALKAPGMSGADEHA